MMITKRMKVFKLQKDGTTNRMDYKVKR